MISDNIKIIRKNKGYSQEELAEKIHVTRQTLSKWENGLSTPDAESLKNIASIFDISISELVEDDAEKIIENEVIIDQLSRINEQLIISNKQSKKNNQSILKIAIICFLVLLLILGIFIIKDRNSKGYRVTKREHLSTLTYYLPYNTFYHGKDDVAVTVLDKDEYLITGKCYRNYDDMTEVSILKHESYKESIIDEFKEKYPDYTESLISEYNSLPDGTIYYIAATDEGPDKNGIYHIGTYYKAYILLDKNLYSIEVINGDNVTYIAESIVSSMLLDETQKEEYWKN